MLLKVKASCQATIRTFVIGELIVSRLVFLVRAASISATLFLLPAASCAQQASDMETSSAANEIVFPDGTVIDVDIPMEVSSLLEEIEEMGAPIEPYPKEARRGLMA